MADAPLTPPPRQDPQRRTRVPAAPPAARSRAALFLSAAAAEGRFLLQTCAACGRVQYPPRDACGRCLSLALPWREQSPWGEVLAVTTVHVSNNVYFRERAPWPLASVRLDCGPVAICHRHPACSAGQRVRVVNRLDKSGQAVLLALPEQELPHMHDQPLLREFSCDPKFRRVLISDGRDAVGQALARALSAAGASEVFVGEAEGWRSYPGRAALVALPKVSVLPLDVTDTDSVTTLAGEIGGKVDILINNARYLRPGSIFERGDVVFAKNEIEVNYLGLMRLAQAFGPAMRGRGADGVNSAVAWVNLLSVYALANLPSFGAFAASSAAALSLAQCLRAELRPGGVRVVNVFSGPTDDAWHQPLPPPKVGAEALARAVVGALRDGLEDVYVGAVAEDVIARWRAGPRVLERELADALL